MAIKLIANYSKRLGLPGYSSHQFSVSVETEVVHPEDIAGESERLYLLLQQNVDSQIQHTGFVPPVGYGEESAAAPPLVALPAKTKPVSASSSAASPRWKCSDKQRELILKLVAENDLDKDQVDHLARQRFGKSVRQLDKMEASGLIDELIETQRRQPEPVRAATRPSAYSRERSAA